MNGMNLTTAKDMASAIPEHYLGKKSKKIILPDGTELSEEELKQFDDTHSWGKLGKNRK